MDKVKIKVKYVKLFIFRCCSCKHILDLDRFSIKKIKIRPTRIYIKNCNLVAGWRKKSTVRHFFSNPPCRRPIRFINNRIEYDQPNEGMYTIRKKSVKFL